MYKPVDKKQSGGKRSGSGRKQVNDKKKEFRIYLHTSRVARLEAKYGKKAARKLIEEKVKEIEILGRIVFTPLIVPELGQREAVVNPTQGFLRKGGVCRKFFLNECHDQASPF